MTSSGIMVNSLYSSGDAVEKAAMYYVYLTRNAVHGSLWIKHRSTAFFQDIVPGWNDWDLSTVCVSREAFLYLVSNLQPVLLKQDFLGFKYFT